MSVIISQFRTPFVYTLGMIVLNEGTAEYIIEKSRFIAFLCSCEDEEEAKERLQMFRKEYYDSTHVCYACILDDVRRSSDDGEPSGTAGIPILNYLSSRDLNHVLGVVVRYFGGVKLGTGGLHRAYTAAIASAYENAEIGEEIERDLYRIALPYDLGAKVRSLLEKEGCLLETDYGEEVILRFFDQGNIRSRIISLTKTIEAENCGKQKVYKKV